MVSLFITLGKHSRVFNRSPHPLKGQIDEQDLSLNDDSLHLEHWFALSRWTLEIQNQCSRL